jgi:hypothetical protein
MERVYTTIAFLLAALLLAGGGLPFNEAALTPTPAPS